MAGRAYGIKTVGIMEGVGSGNPDELGISCFVRVDACISLTHCEKKLLFMAGYQPLSGGPGIVQVPGLPCAPVGLAVCATGLVNYVTLRCLQHVPATCNVLSGVSCPWLSQRKGC